MKPTFGFSGFLAASSVVCGFRVTSVAMSRPETRNVTELRPIARIAPTATTRAPPRALERACAREDVSWIRPFASASCSFSRIDGIMARSAG